MGETKLHEILAVEGDLEARAKDAMHDAKTKFSTPAFFHGFKRELEMFDGDDGTHYPPETQQVTYVVDEILKSVSDHSSRYFDVMLAKESTNQMAKADLIVNGETISKDLPATFLLGMESRLKVLKNALDTIPTLPPGRDYVLDEDVADNIFKTRDPERTFKTANRIKHKVLYDATKEHPAQIEKWSEQENVGAYTKVEWFSSMSPNGKRKLIQRLNDMIMGCKKARQKANSVEVTRKEVGRDIFGYLFSE